MPMIRRSGRISFWPMWRYRRGSFQGGASFPGRGAAERRPREVWLPPGGCFRRGCAPHSLFVLDKKRMRRARWKRKNRFWSQLCTSGAKLLYGGWREMVPAGLRCLSDGRGGVRYRLERGFPRRGCGGQRVAKSHLTSFSFRAFRFATRCRVLRGSVSGSEKRNCSMRQPPRRRRNHPPRDGSWGNRRRA